MIKDVLYAQSLFERLVGVSKCGFDEIKKFFQYQLKTLASKRPFVNLQFV